MRWCAPLFTLRAVGSAAYVHWHRSRLDAFGSSINPFPLLFCIQSVINLIDKSGASCGADAPGSCSATPAGRYRVRGVGRPIRWAAVSEVPCSRGTIASHYAIANGAASALSSAQYTYGRADAHCPTSQWECEPHARRRACSQRGTLNCTISVHA